MRHRIKYGLDHWTIGPLDYFLDNFLGPFFFFWTILSGGGGTICTQGGVGCSLSVLREE